MNANIKRKKQRARKCGKDKWSVFLEGKGRARGLVESRAKMHKKGQASDKGP